MTFILSANTIKTIALIFCGDQGDYYTYKTGPNLVSFFNQYYNSNDVYQAGFPTRWEYVYNKLVVFLNTGTFNRFLTHILSKEFIMLDIGCTLVEAAEKANIIVTDLNRILRAEAYFINHKGAEYFLVRDNDDLIFVGSGGFANVYLQKSTGRIIKKLKDDFLTNPQIRSRFKREFNITKSLSDLPGIIRVYDYDETNCSYSMEEAEQTLEKFIKNSTLNEETRIRCVRQILQLFNEVHNRDVIHRDISPNNIFLLSGILKVADFGLGKDLGILTSHQTYLTVALGQFQYCAPEQFMLLKDGDKRSDVFSLGRLISFIMTSDPSNSRHIFRNAVEKATNSNPSFRQADAGALLSYVEKSIQHRQDNQNKKQILLKIGSGVLDEEVETYLCELTNEELCKMLIDGVDGFRSVLIRYMKQNETYAHDIIQGVEYEFRQICQTFAEYDPFSNLAYEILKDNEFPFTVKELAANVLRYIAKDINRFHAQRLIESLSNFGLEPMIEDILLT